MNEEDEGINDARRSCELLIEFFAINNFGAKESLCACINYMINAASISQMSPEDFGKILLGVKLQYEQGYPSRA